jgi:hypothetical protein
VELKNAKLKVERYQMQIEILQHIEAKPHSNLNPLKFKSKK